MKPKEKTDLCPICQGKGLKRDSVAFYNEPCKYCEGLGTITQNQ